MEMREKSEIITFKVDRTLSQILKGLRNRSEFIRAAILSALDSSCPLCMGTGVLSATQKAHWSNFARDHALEQCRDCHDLYLTCSHRPEPHEKHRR